MSATSFVRSLAAALGDPDEGLAELDRLDSAESLAAFVRLAWPILEPAAELKWDWPLDAICEHLEAVADGKINRLLINCPPGLMKSLLTGVFFPAWLWGPKNKPSSRFIGSSYSEDYATRDNRRCRDLVASPWYRARWGDRVRLTRVAETSFANDATGVRQGVPFQRLTGGRADFLLLDDPHSTDGAESPADRERTLRTFRESVTTRLNDPEKTAIIIIMQRLHQRDISGLVLGEGFGYEHLCLPMEFEPKRRCGTSVVMRETGQPFVDPREMDGDLLFPARFPREVVERDKRAMGSYAVAAQYQQSPAPRGGGLFMVDRFRIVDDYPKDGQVVRSWDFAATVPEPGTDPDYLVGVKMVEKEGRFWIVDVERDRLSPEGVEILLKATAMRDGVHVKIVGEEEGGSAGKVVSDNIRRKVLLGFQYRAVKPTGSKVDRAGPFAAAVEAGNVALVRGPWLEKFLDEFRNFPNAAHDDQVDATVQAWVELAQAPLFFVG